MRKTKDKRNRTMVFVTVDTDMDGPIECVVFATTYRKYESLVAKDNEIKVRVKGRQEDASQYHHTPDGECGGRPSARKRSNDLEARR